MLNINLNTQRALLNKYHFKLFATIDNNRLSSMTQGTGSFPMLPSANLFRRGTD